MPRKIRQLINDLGKAGFSNKDGKGSHSSFLHEKCPFLVTISGKDGNDARPYQERAVRQALREINK